MRGAKRTATLTDLFDVSLVPSPLAANGTCHDRGSLDQGNSDDQSRGDHLLDAVRRTRQTTQMDKSICRYMAIEWRLRDFFFETSRRETGTAVRLAKRISMYQSVEQGQRASIGGDEKFDLLALDESRFESRSFIDSTLSVSMPRAARE